jgi:hypothetical protein
MKILYIASTLCTSLLLRRSFYVVRVKNAINKCLYLSDNFSTSETGERTLSDKNAGFNKIRFNKIFLDKDIEFIKHKPSQSSNIIINHPGETIKRSYVSYQNTASGIHDGLFNYYILTCITPKEDFISLTPFYNFKDMKNFEYKMTSVDNSYEIFCKEIIYNDILRPYSNNLTCLSLFMKCMCADLQDSTKDLENKFIKYDMRLNESYDTKMMSEYFTDLSNNINERKGSGLPVDLILDILIKKQETDNPDYEKLMSIVNDIVNILNLYKNVRISNYKKEFKPKIYKIDEDLLNKKETPSKLILHGKSEYSIEVEGISDKNIKKVSEYQIKGDDNDLKIVFDFYNLKNEGIEKVLMRIKDEEEEIKQEVEIPNYIEEEEPMLLDYNN